MGAAGDVSRIVPDYLTLFSSCLCSMSRLSYPLSTLLHHETFHIYDDCNSLRTVGMLLLYCAPKLWNSSKFWSFFLFCILPLFCLFAMCFMFAIFWYTHTYLKVSKWRCLSHLETKFQECRTYVVCRRRRIDKLYSFRFWLNSVA